MPTSRTFTLLVLLLVVTVVAAALAPAPPLPPPAPVPSVAPRDDPPVTRTLPGPQRTVVVRTGDELELTVRSVAGDAVQVAGLSALRAVAPGAPVTFDLLADAPGRYPVVLLSGATLGVVRVISRRASARAGAGPSPHTTGT